MGGTARYRRRFQRTTFVEGCAASALEAAEQASNFRRCRGARPGRGPLAEPDAVELEDEANANRLAGIRLAAIAAMVYRSAPGRLAHEQRDSIHALATPAGKPSTLAPNRVAEGVPPRLRASENVALPMRR